MASPLLRALEALTDEVFDALAALDAGAGGALPDELVEPLREIEGNVVATAYELRRFAGSREFGREVARVIGRYVDRRWGEGMFGEFGSPSLLYHEYEDAGLFLAYRLARSWKLYQPVERSAIQERAEESGRTVEEEKVYVLATGLAEAMADRDREQTVRLGASWITDADSRKKKIVPAHLGWATFDAIWLPAAAMRAARDALLEELPLPREVPVGIDLEDVLPLEDYADLPGMMDDPLAKMIREERRQVLGALTNLASLTDADRGLLDAYLEHGDWTVAGEELGLAPATIRQRKRRLIERLSRVLPSP